MDEQHWVFGTGVIGRTLIESLESRERKAFWVAMHDADTHAIRLLPDLRQNPDLSLTVYFCPSPSEWQKPMATWPVWQAWRKALTDWLKTQVSETSSARSSTGPFSSDSRALNPRLVWLEHPAASEQEPGDMPADDAIAKHIVTARGGEPYGPGSLHDLLTANVLRPALREKKVTVPTGIDAPQSLHYLPDVVRALRVLGERRHAYGKSWTLPCPPAVSLRQLLAEATAALGRDIHAVTVSKTRRRMAGLLNPSLRSTDDVLTAFEEAHVVDSRPIECAFGLQGTPISTAVAETLHWLQKTEGEAKSRGRKQNQGSALAAAKARRMQDLDRSLPPK